MLNILTIAYRYDLLKPLWDSIPKEMDITWWICTTSNKQVKIKDSRIKIINLNISDDPSTSGERFNTLFSNIYEGWFQIIDEDTLFHENSYRIYTKYKEKEVMVIGNQLYHNDNIRIKAQKPREAFIDTGNVICHHNVLKFIKWDDSIICPDYIFWNKCYEYYNRRALILDEPISYYNYQIKQEEG